MSYSSEVLADSPLVYWRLGDSSGTTAVDSSGNGRDATYSGPPTLGATSLVATDATNTAVTFTTNSGQRAAIASASWMDTSNLTVEAFASLSSSVDATNGDAIVSRYQSGGFNWLLWRNQTGHWAVQLRNNSGTAYNVADTASVTLNTTYHLAFVFDGSTLTLYVNGASVGSTGVTGTVQTAAKPIEVARYSASGVTTPGGTIDEVAVYGTALSSTRIAAHYTAATSADATGTLATTLDDATLSATAVEDFTGTSAVVLDDATLAADGVAGTPPVTGTLATTLDDATAAVAGTVANPVAGTLTSTLDDTALAGTAIETFAGTATTSLDDSTFAGSATETMTGIITVTLADAGMTATGTEAIPGTMAATLDDATLAATSSETITALVAITLADATLTTAGLTGDFQDITITATVTLGRTAAVTDSSLTAAMVANPRTATAGANSRAAALAPPSRTAALEAT